MLREYLLPRFELVTLQGLAMGEAEFIRDVNDRHLFVAAQAGRADIVVLRDGSTQQSSGPAWRGVQLITTAQFLERFEGSDLEEPEPDEGRRAVASRGWFRRLFRREE
jgi:hypothetical protein